MKLWPMSLVACLILLIPAGSQAQQLPAEPTVLQPGDSVPETMFAFTREQAESLALTLDSLRTQVAQLKQDTANLSAQRDSVRSALVACGQKVEAKTVVAEAERDARKALQEAQPSGLEKLLTQGPSGFMVGTGVGLTGGVLACRGAN